MRTQHVRAGWLLSHAESWLVAEHFRHGFSGAFGERGFDALG
jgi:hypothetical protein